MNRLIVNIQPFTLNQRIDVTTEDNYETSITCNFDTLIETALKTASTYNCTKICFKGAYNFTSRYANELSQKASTTEYASKNLEVEIL